MKTFYEELNGHHPLDLHRLMGVNCFQSMMGYNPVIVVMPGGVYGLAVYYPKMLPGGYEPLEESGFRNTHLYRDEIIHRLERDDCFLSSDTASLPNQNQGALYFSEPTKYMAADFHVVSRGQNGQYHSKIRFHAEQTYDALPPEIGRYKFFGHLSIPAGKTPEFAKVEGAVVSSSAHDGMQLDFLILPPESFTPMIGHSAIHYDISTKRAYLEDEAGIIDLPFPHIPGFMVPADLALETFELSMP